MSHNSTDGGTSDAGSSTSLIIGLTGDDTNGIVGSVHVTTAIDGTPATDQVVVVLNNASAFPMEIKLAPPPIDLSAHVDFRADAYIDPTWDATKTAEVPILTRTAETAFIPDQQMLMRIKLQSACITSQGGAGFMGPTCTVANQTCEGALCVDDTVTPDKLEPYMPDWATNAPDICKPANAGPPDVIVGTGQTDYLPLTDGQTVQAELGPQGGHHIWIAVRMHNLKQVGSTTTITGTQTGTSVTVPPTSFVFVFNQDEGGFCSLAGLRFQLDSGGTDYHLFLGKPLDVQVVVKDTTGAIGTGTVHINIDPSILCPNGSNCPP